MRSRVLIDFAFILLLYGIYAAVMIWIYGADRFSGPNAQYFPLIVFGVSLFAMLLWYGLGEWGIRPNAPVGTWFATWFFLLAAIVVTAAVVSFLEAKFAALHSFADSYPALHFAGGIGFFYLGSVLFSAASVKYLIWPARHVRTW